MKADEYLKKPYRRVLIPDTEIGGFTATIAEFPGCLAEGDTAVEALTRLESAALSWIEAALSLGQTIPDPEEQSAFSGKIALRVPKSLHRRAVEQARKEGTSLNQFLTSAIAEKLGQAAAVSRVLEELPELRTSIARVLAVIGSSRLAWTWDLPAEHFNFFNQNVRLPWDSEPRPILQGACFLVSRKERPLPTFEAQQTRAKGQHEKAPAA